MKRIPRWLAKLAAVSLLCILVLSLFLPTACDTQKTSDSGQSYGTELTPRNVGSPPPPQNVVGAPPPQNVGAAPPPQNVAAAPAPGSNEPDEQDLFMHFNFRATHNSYSGNNADDKGGYRGSIVQQLDLGLRYLEIDIPGGPVDGAFQVGHSTTKSEDRVYHSKGNPESNDLGDWLEVIANWSRSGENSGHDPIVVALEVKEGNDFKADFWKKLSDLVGKSFQGIIVAPSDFHGNKTTLKEVKGKVFVVSIPANGKLTTSDPLIFKCNDALEQEDNVVFYTRHASDANATMIDTIRSDDKSIRLAFFGNNDHDTSLPASNYPSCDTPYFGWYARYFEDNGIETLPDFHLSGVTWYEEHRYDRGINVDAAVNNSGMVVEVHNAHSDPDELWYNAGVLDTANKVVNWFLLPDDKRHYSSGGIDPTVALNDSGIVVEVHATEGNNLYCRAGVLNSGNGTITWSPSAKYDTGRRPSVGINNDNMVVEVHQSPDGSDLWYNVGKVEQIKNGNYAIAWGDLTKKRQYDAGEYPSVAFCGDKILEAHTGKQLWCTIGELDAQDKEIDWVSYENKRTTYAYPYEEEGSVHPDVALNEQSGFEVHRSSSSDYLWWRPGKASNTVMAWGGGGHRSKTYTAPSVAMTAQDVLVFSRDNDNNLICQVGSLSP